MKALCLSLAVAMGIGIGLAAIAEGQEPVSLGPRQSHTIPPRLVSVLLDDSAALTFAQVSAAPWRDRFLPRTEDHLNFGVTRAAVWLRFRVHNDSQSPDWVLLLENLGLERVEMYVRSAAGISPPLVTGNKVPAAAMEIPGREDALPLRLAPGDTAEVHLRITASLTLSVLPRVVTPRAFAEHAFSSELLAGGIYGAMTLLLVVSLWMFLRYPDVRHGAFFFMILIQAVFIAAQDSDSTALFWPAHPDWTWTVRAVARLLAAPAILLYLLLTLDIRRAQPLLHGLGLALALGSLVCVALIPWLPVHSVKQVSHGLGMAIVATSLVGIAVACWRGHPLGRLSLLSYAPVAVLALAAQAHRLAWFSGPSRLVVQGYQAAFLFFVVLQLISLRGRVRQEREQLAGHEERVRQWQDPLLSLHPPPEAGHGDKPVIVHTLGRFEVWRNKAPVSLSRRRPSRSQELLALIIAGGMRGKAKPELMESLWPDTDGDLAEKSFRTTLYRLRKSIGVEAIKTADGTVRLDPDIVWEESMQFESLASGFLARHPDFPERQFCEKGQALLRLYLHDFLPDRDGPAILARREQLRGVFHELLLEVARRFAERGALRDALAVYRLGIERSAPSEAIFHGLMRCQLALGRASDGLQTCERCKTYLAEQFAIAPSTECERLRMTLLASAGA